MNRQPAEGAAQPEYRRLALFGRAWENGQQIVPGIQLGLDQTNDPASAMFSTANFTGASTAQLTDARELYGLLTGRVTSVTGQAALDAETGKYVAFGPRRRSRPIERVFALHAGLLARDADPHLDRRRPLGRADAVHRRPTTSCRR